MAKGSMRMAKKGVVVKKLSAIPSFGSMEVLCTDKTGTITEDKIKLIKYVDANGDISEPLFVLAYLNSRFQTGIKNPLDDAVLAHKVLDISAYHKIDEIPFDFSRRRMSVVTETGGTITFICKGAPEEIFKLCTDNRQLLEIANQQYELLSADGFRVLAIATKSVQRQVKFTVQDERQLQLQGFIAFLDPPKEDADETIAELEKIGVEVKIITGDNHLVTQKICKEINLPIKGTMQGYELEHLTDDALRKRVTNTTIFTRFSPDQKNRIISALKAYHRSVGYLGDGINDAPSLKSADIGISVNSATDVAKDSADIILTEKDLLVLKEGIIEGRKTFGNNMKYILMVLSSNFGNMFSVAFATLVLPFLPMLPVQILLNNFLYDISQTAIPTDNVDENYTRQPQRWNLRMIRNYMFIFGFTSSLFDFITFYLLFHFFEVTEAQFRTGWFMESLATQILVVFIIRTNYYPFIQSRPSNYLVLSTLVCLAAGWVLPYLSFGKMVGFEPLPSNVLVFIIIIVLSYLVCAEFVKRRIYHRLYGTVH
jgi:Mg2+-importing ATPase